MGPGPALHPDGTVAAMSATEGLSFGWGRRLPMVLQTEAAECGLACISMVAGFFGYPVDSAALRRRFGLSLKGGSLKDLIGHPGPLGFPCPPRGLAPHGAPIFKAP